MRRVTARLGQDRGASAVLVAVLLVPLLGFAAIALDVGALYVERGQLQNGADAAALAIARGCAMDGVCTNSEAKAAAFADANANDGAANVLTPTFPTDTSVTVTSSTRVAGTNADAISHPFARFIGIDSTTVHATATAEWGPAGGGLDVLPLTLSYCEFVASGSLVHEVVSIRTDTNLICKRAPSEPEVPGGFGWLDTPAGSCTVSIQLNPSGELWMGSDPGNSVSHDCQTRLEAEKGKTVLIPIHDGARGSGQNSEYRIYGFAAFKVTGWVFSNTRDPDPLAPSCSGNCRAIQGYFERWVSVDGAIAVGGPQLNAYSVRLSQ